MTDITPIFRNALDAFGPPELGESASHEVISALRGKIPDSLLDFWTVHGFGLWLDGYFQFCNPLRYQPVLDMVLKGDPDFHAARSHIVGFSAFGALLVWNEDYRIMDISTLHHRVTCSRFFREAASTKPDTTIGIAIGNVNDEAGDPPDEDGKPLFKRVLKACGKLEFGQIYSLKLHPALGGAIRAENFRAVSALEALAIAAQAGPFTLYDTSVPRVPAVRNIGRPD